MKKKIIENVLGGILILCCIAGVYLYKRHFSKSTENREQTYQMFNCFMDLKTADLPPQREYADMENSPAKHCGVDSVTVYLKYPAETPTGYVYLAVENTTEMYPSIKAKTEGDSARFTNLSKGLIYCPVYCVNGRQTAAGDPFWFDSSGRIKIFNPDTPNILLAFNAMTPNRESYTSKINAEEEYELFVWKKDDWQSLGKQKATKKMPEWNVPSEALFRIDNKTENKKGTAFYMVDKLQMFWRAKPTTHIRCKSVRVSDVRNNVPAEQGKNAIDGKIDGNRWVAVGEGAHWIELDLEKNSYIHSFRFITGNSQGKPQASYETKRFEFQGWNGAGWTTLASDTKNTQCTYSENFIPFRTNRVRLVTYGDTRLIEIEIYDL
ncbi:MAG: discoidin domain-containing protein [Prevotellaceae bacterium]|nr:discoidin domain-containing protein [Prevotellaceae bacterium]